MSEPLLAPSADGQPPVIELVDAMPGLPAMAQCVLVQLDETAALYRLQSMIDPDLRLLVAASPVFFADYAPEIDEETAAKIGLTDAADALVLLVITVGGSAAESTANLLAPIVLNASTRQAAQVLQQSADLPLQAPLIPAA
jgi:flagellar assembly factor FliW